MAASGGNIEWSTTVKPILTSLHGPFFDNDVVEIIQAIIKRLVLLVSIICRFVLLLVIFSVSSGSYLYHYYDLVFLFSVVALSLYSLIS